MARRVDIDQVRNVALVVLGVLCVAFIVMTVMNTMSHNDKMATLQAKANEIVETESQPVDDPEPDEIEKALQDATEASNAVVEIQNQFLSAANGDGLSEDAAGELQTQLAEMFLDEGADVVWFPAADAGVEWRACPIYEVSDGTVLLKWVCYDSTNTMVAAADAVFTVVDGKLSKLERTVTDYGSARMAVSVDENLLAAVESNTDTTNEGEN